MPTYSVPNVSSGLWCMSVQAQGTVLKDIDVIKQRVYVVLNTPLGSDPFRPLFGCDYHKYIDGNLTTAPPKIKKEIIEALSIWVPEVKLSKISYTVGAGKLVFKIMMVYAGSITALEFGVGRGLFFGGISGWKIINTDIPYGATNLKPTLTVGGLPASPAVPGTLPWDDIAGMMVWIRANWNQYGNWGYSRDEVILYLGRDYQSAILGLAIV